MINAKYINCNESVLFGTIIEEKNGPRKPILRGIRTRVISSYDRYMNDFTSLQSQNRSDFEITIEREALQSCYTSHTQSFKIIRGRIFDTQSNQLKSLCPYCLLDKPKTLDHYIGQTEFPEYSTLIKNLIPCCYDCNQKKKENWRSYSKRRFIHFYNDSFISERFLYANLIYPRGQQIPRIQFRLSKPNTISIDEFKIVKCHFKDLDLLNEYNRRSNALISSEIMVLEESFLSGISKQNLTDQLLTKSRSQARDFGANYWSSVMYETIANTSRLINSL